MCNIVDILSIYLTIKSAVKRWADRLYKKKYMRNPTRVLPTRRMMSYTYVPTYCHVQRSHFYKVVPIMIVIKIL